MRASRLRFSRSPRYPLGMHALLMLLFAQLLFYTAACEPAQQLRAESLSSFRELNAARQQLDPENLDYSLLAEAIFHETNVRRESNGLVALDHLVELDRAACVHVEAMVEQDFFAHRNPSDPQLATPADRVRQQGLEIGFVAENIGEVFALRYQSGERVYLRQEGGRTVFTNEPGGEPLGRRTYLQVAEALLDSWMASEGHRRNILARRPDYFGAGCQSTEDEQMKMPMLSCVQLFFAPLGGRLD